MKGLYRGSGMTAKEYLSQIKLLDRKIEQRIQQAEELRRIAYGLRSPEIKQDAVQTSPEGDPIGNAVIRYVDVETEIDTMVDRYVNLKHKIIGEIHELEDPRMIDLLYLRYVKYMTLEEIACTMEKANGGHYSYDHTRRLHWKALKEFSKRHGNVLKDFPKCHSNATFERDIM